MVQMSLLLGGITAAATAFIAEHTTSVSDVDGMCPVCHENYSSLDDIRVLKVNDVAACKHIFCEACIGKVLSSPWVQKRSVLVAELSGWQSWLVKRNMGTIGTILSK
jgi:hypothetical protein